jgi:hypothetical protein
MREGLGLAELGDRELVAELTALVRRSNELTAELLAHLAELEQRMIHLELGFPSLHAYCVHALGMSEGAAGRRVIAARVCTKFPEALALVAQGKLHLSAVCALAGQLTSENASELLAASTGKTRRQVEEILATKFPQADVRERIRRESARGRELEPLSPGRFGVHFTADTELKELIERARALASHRLPERDLASLMKLVFASFVAREEKRRFGVDSKRSKQPDSAQAGIVDGAAPPGGVCARRIARVKRSLRTRRPRYLAIAARRLVYQRDGGRCTFVAANGKRCEETALLQFDHVEPHARGGPDTARNLRLRCAGHNRLHARNCFGAEQVDRYAKGVRKVSKRITKAA